MFSGMHGRGMVELIFDGGFRIDFRKQLRRRAYEFKQSLVKL